MSNNITTYVQFLGGTTSYLIILIQFSMSNSTQNAENEGVGNN